MQLLRHRRQGDVGDRGAEDRDGDGDRDCQDGAAARRLRQSISLVHSAVRWVRSWQATWPMAAGPTRCATASNHFIGTVKLSPGRLASRNFLSRRPGKIGTIGTPYGPEPCRKLPNFVLNLVGLTVPAPPDPNN